MLFCSKMVVFGKGDCNRAIWFYSGKIGCIRAKVVDLRQIGGFLEKWLSSGKSGCSRGKVVIFEQNLLFSNKNGFIRVKRLYFGQNVVFVQKWLYSDKVVVLGHKWL